MRMGVTGSSRKYATGINTHPPDRYVELSGQCVGLDRFSVGQGVGLDRFPVVLERPRRWARPVLGLV